MSVTKTYVLNRDWVPFSKGELFKDYCGNGLYNLNGNEDVLVKIPDEYLDEQNHVWRPKNDEMYFYIDADEVMDEDYFSEYDHYDTGRLATGNCFKTNEEAKNMRDWLKVRQNLINSGAQFTNDINKTYYSVWYCKPTNKLEAYRSSSGHDDYIREKLLCFDSEQLAEDSIEHHKDDWLIYLDVKEK